MSFVGTINYDKRQSEKRKSLELLEKFRLILFVFGSSFRARKEMPNKHVKEAINRELGVRDDRGQGFVLA